MPRYTVLIGRSRDQYTEVKDIEATSAAAAEAKVQHLLDNGETFDNLEWSDGENDGSIDTYDVTEQTDE